MLTFFAAIEQPYSAADIIMNDAHVMLDNSVTLACSVPAHLSDHVTVVAWRVEESHRDPIELNKEPASYGSVHNLHGSSRSPNVLKGPRLQNWSASPLWKTLSILHPDISQVCPWLSHSSS